VGNRRASSGSTACSSTRASGGNVALIDPSIDAIAALKPKAVVAGHKRVGAPDLPENLAASQRYLRDFTGVAKKSGTVQDLVQGMLELHGERDQPHTLWISARAEVARRA
jgi:hypothetical protein